MNLHRLPPNSLFLRFAPAMILTTLFLLGGMPTADAQVDRAELEGTVSDTSGSVIVGASVKVVAVETGLSVVQPTNSKGYYRFPGLAVGGYTVTVTQSGFKTKAIQDVVLRVGQTRTLDVALTVGAIEEKVEVKAANEPSDRTTAEAATVIDSDQIAELPNNGRDWASFTLLAPFAQDDGGGDQRTIRFAGRARDDNNFSIDGVDAGGIQEQAQKSQTRLQISQDAIEEYRVNSAVYDVEYGTQAGGQIDVETKSGSNAFHGTAFGYLRNSVFDARNFNDYNLAGNPQVPPFRLGQYGMALGGPIQKNKLFFFINYEGLRQLQSTTEQVNVPAGVCCASFPSPEPQNITVPYQKYVLDEATSLGYGPQMCQIMQAFSWRASVGSIDGCTPRFVYPDSAFTYQGGNQDLITFPAPTTVHEDTWLVRIDYKIGENTLLYGRAGRDISLVDAPNGSGSLATDKLQTINHPANYTMALEHTFRPTLFNEIKGYINRAPFHNPQASALPYAVSTNDFVGLNNDSADIEIGTTYGAIDNLIWSRGRHTFKAGMEYRRVRLNQGQTSNNVLTFSDDYSLSQASLSNINYIAPWCCHGLRRNFFMPYFQDEWKATPTLTLTAGLRWDYYGVAHEATNRTTVFDLYQFHGVCLGTGSFNVAPTPGPINTAPCPANPALYNPSYVNFDPRLAVAWAPSALHGKTVVHAGFGIYHGAAQNDDLNAGLESDTFRVLVNNFGACTAPIYCPNLQPEFQQQDPTFTGLSSLSKQANHPRALQREGRRDLYVETWTLSVEHQLPANFLASAQYLGSHGVRLFSRGGVNLCTEPVTFNPVDGDCVRTLDQYYPGGNPFGSVDSKKDIGSSTYNGLGLSMERRFSAGLELQARYTWSHSINDGSVGGGESSGPENVNCLPCDKGPSIFDVRNNITFNAVYDLPFGPGKPFMNAPGVIGTVFGGWQISSIGLWHTGHPLTVSMDLSNSISNASSPFNGLPYTYLLPDGNDQTNQRPDVIPGVPLILHGQHPATPNNPGAPYINAAAFQAPPVDANGNFTRFGDESNGMIRALNYWQIDFALTKETKLTERVAMLFTVQAFNIFNHVQFGDPGALNLVYDPTAAGTGFLTPQGGFGVISTTVNFNNNNDNAASPNTGTGLPRQLQFMLRFRF
jgi:Carboxypeptidase regulatory-like domain/TonB dependent receptor-like, beta-barrel